MKKLLLVICGFLLVTGSYAQESKMNYVYSLDEAFQKAKNENKLIFFNCFADWVVTCHAMDKFVFSDEAFAKYMDEKFVNLLIDVSKSENRMIADKYGISFFAHYLILDFNGQVVHRIVGGAELPKFKDNIALALNPKTSLRGMNKRYDDGERSVKFLRSYLYVLNLASEREKYSVVSQQFLAKIDKKDWAKAENWAIIKKELKNDQCEYFKYLIANKATFVKNSGADAINSSVGSVFTREMRSYATAETPYNANAVALARLKLVNAELPEEHLLYRFLEVAKLRGERKFAELAEYLKTKFTSSESRTLDMINISLKETKETTAAEKKILIDYLTEVAATKKGSAQAEYRLAISQIDESKGIQFFQGTFSEALSTAKKEGKLIFFDGYTSWCAPCKAMAAQVFTRKDVGDYFNAKFINFKIDMERGEGVGLAEKYNIVSFPTFLLIDGDGVSVHRILGSSNAGDFMREIELGTLKETSYSYLTNPQNIEQNKNNVRFNVNHLIAKRNALELSNLSKPLSEYLMSIKNISELADSQIMNSIMVEITDYKNPIILKIINNSDVFKKKLGEKIYAENMEQLFFPALLKSMEESGNAATYAELKELVGKMKFSKDVSLNHLIAIGDMNKKKEYDKIINYYQNVVSKISNDETKLNIDLLIPYVINSATPIEQTKLKEYANDAAKKSDKRLAKGYEFLLKKL